MVTTGVILSVDIRSYFYPPFANKEKKSNSEGSNGKDSLWTKAGLTYGKMDLLFYLRHTMKVKELH